MANAENELARLRRLNADLQARVAALEQEVRAQGGPRRSGHGSEHDPSEKEALIRSFGSNLPHAMLYQVAIGPDGRGRRFTYLSESVRRLHGCTPAEAIADPSRIYGQVVEEDRQFLQREEERALAAFLPFSIQIRLRSPSGGIRWSHFASAPRRLEDSSVRWDGVEVDITERKRAEEERAALMEELLQAQKMESVGRLAGGVAHDFNNLLTPILGHGELLLEGFGPNDARRGDLEAVLWAAERARQLVRQLLAFSRKQTLELRPIDLNSVIVEFVKLLRRTLREHIRVEFVPAPGLPRVRADVVQIEQVLMNLAVNAQDAMPAGGRLTIATAVSATELGPATVPGNHGGGRTVVLTVRDSGEGMDAATRERIFEPFFTTKGKGKGTGLGLATVHGIVAQHGGSIRVESLKGKGSEFIISLPAVGPEGENGEPPVAAAPVAVSGSGTILLAEDDDAVRRLAETVLTRQGYTLLVARDGAEALALLAHYEAPVDLLLTDVVMPEMNGRDLYLQAVGTRPDLRVLFMSGYASDVVAPHGVTDAGVHFLQKPFTGRRLAARVQEVLAGERTSVEAE